MGYSLGLGLTSDCDLACAHCYRPSEVRHLSPAAVRSVVEELGDIAAVNLGTGESIRHPQLDEILDDLLDRRLRVSLVSNGATVLALPVEKLARLAEVEVSIDFPERAAMDEFRGAGTFDRARRALARAASAGVRTTVLAVLMRRNHRELGALARLAASLGAPLRVNVYQPVHSREFLPTWDEFWFAVEELARETTILGISEPVIAAVAGTPLRGTPCGIASVRVTPTGERRACVYLPSETESAALRRVPEACRGCRYEDVCRGGCPSRRRLLGLLDRPDPYCPVARGPRGPLAVKLDSTVERLHLANVCTLLVRA